MHIIQTTSIFTVRFNILRGVWAQNFKRPWREEHFATNIMTIVRLLRRYGPLCYKQWPSLWKFHALKYFWQVKRKLCIFSKWFRVWEIICCTEYKKCNLSIMWHFSRCCQFWAYLLQNDCYFIFEIVILWRELLKSRFGLTQQNL